MTPWFVHELRNLGLEFLDARHARAALKVQIKKTDQFEREVTGERIRDKVAEVAASITPFGTVLDGLLYIETRCLMWSPRIAPRVAAWEHKA